MFWAKRRHPTKYKLWISNKYWHSDGQRKWIFSDGIKKLKFLSDTKIVRHTKLKLDMNPYLDREYFVLRKLKLRARRLAANAKKTLDKVKICKPETETMTNNCCPI